MITKSGQNLVIWRDPTHRRLEHHRIDLLLDRGNILTKIRSQSYLQTYSDRKRLLPQATSIGIANPSVSTA